VKAPCLPVRVRLDRSGQPAAFLHRGRWHRVAEVLDRWRERGRWWEGEPPREVYRVVTTSGAVYELGREGDAWRLYAVLD